MTDPRPVEAVLFTSGSYLSTGDIADLAGVDEEEISSIVEELRGKYDSIDSALSIFEENGKYKMNVVEDYSYVVRSVVSEAELRDALMETLALIAYKAPVLQSDIVEARSARAYTHIKELLDRGFVERERDGRTFRLDVTDTFYDYFEVANRNELGQVFEAVQPPDVDVELDAESGDEDSKERFENFLSDRLREVEERDQDKERAFLENIDERLDAVREDVDEIETDVAPPETEEESAEEDELNESSADAD
jgi:segregation and condensation protein B